MRVLLVAALAAALVGLLQGVDLARSAAAPTLRVVRLSPFTLRGTNFKAGEKVTVTIVAGKRATARATADSRGSFTVRLAVPVTKCTKYSLKAAGALGSRVSLASRLGAACKPKARVEFGASVVVVGTNFQPGERVSVTLSADETWTAKAVASAKGSFSADLGQLPLSECHAYKLTAVGSRGSRFAFTHPTAPC
jgi:hypothetical protein